MTRRPGVLRTIRRHYEPIAYSFAMLLALALAAAGPALWRMR